MSGPVVSICFATRNHGRQLRETIPSILAQSETDWELLIWDDGSTDDTRAYLESLSDARIRITWAPYSQGDPHRLSRVYLDLIADAGAPLVCMTSSTVVWHPDKLQRQLAAFRDDPALSLSTTAAWLIDDLDGSRSGQVVSSLPILSDRPLLALCLRNWVVSPSVMFRKADFLAGGGHDSSFLYSADYHHWLRFALRGPFHFATEALMGYRLHRDSHSQQPKVQRTWQTCDPAALQDVIAHVPADSDTYRPADLAEALVRHERPGMSPAIFKELALQQARRAAASATASQEDHTRVVRLLATTHRHREAARLQPYSDVAATELQQAAQAWQAALDPLLPQALRRLVSDSPGIWLASGAWGPVAAAALGHRAWLAGRHEEAAVFWHDAYRQQSNDPALLQNIGHYHAVSDAAVGRRHWELAASLRPRDPGLQALLERPALPRVYAVAPSPAASQLAAAGWPVTIGGPLHPDTADVVLLHDRLSLQLLACDPAPLFLWPEPSPWPGLDGLDNRDPAPDQVMALLTGVRRRYLPWGDPPDITPARLPSQKARHWLLWLEAGCDPAALRAILRTYLQAFSGQDDCCLVVAYDTAEPGWDAVSDGLRAAADEWGQSQAAILPWPREHLTWEARSVFRAMSAILVSGPAPGQRSLAATIGLPVIEADDPDWTITVRDGEPIGSAQDR